MPTEHKKKKGLIKVRRVIKVSASGEYDVIIDKGILDESGEILKKIKAPCKALIVTDSVVAPLYLERVKKSFENTGYEVLEFVFESGEKSKNISTLSSLLEYAAENRMNSSDLFVALGGGVTGDLTGFASAVYLRGTDFVQIPTTLLAMVDSSVGGKTAIDLKAGKNLAGAFYQPIAVICDYTALDTLKEETFAEGMAEVIKYGVIFDKELFDSVKDGNVKDIIDSIIYRCIELKRSVVEIDEHDNGERQLLNFGHTIGHAIEKCSGFSISHGNSVAIGMMIAAKASFALGFSSEDCAPEIKEALINNRLPVSASFSAEELYEVTLCDKKRRGKTINLIVPEKIGKCFRKEQSTDRILEFIKCGI